MVVYGPPDDAIAAEPALPKLMFVAAWLHDKALNVPAVQVAVWLLLWLINEDAVALVDGELVLVEVESDPAPAAEITSPALKFLASWLHEP